MFLVAIGMQLPPKVGPLPAFDSQRAQSKSCRPHCSGGLLCRDLQISGVEGADGNTLGWAARDSGAVLAPYKFTRRDMGPKDVYIKITHAGLSK